jgi:hypothetical protein
MDGGSVSGLGSRSHDGYCEVPQLWQTLRQKMAFQGKWLPDFQATSHICTRSRNSGICCGCKMRAQNEEPNFEQLMEMARGVYHYYLQVQAGFKSIPDHDEEIKLTGNVIDARDRFRNRRDCE